MIRNSILFVGLSTLLASGVLAEEAPPLLVSKPEMCAMIARGEDTQEVGMILTAEGMYEIEYYCEFSTPLDLYWAEERIDTRVGYCAAPGEIMPTVFAYQMSDYEPGVVRVWTQGIDDPVEFSRCWNQ